MQPALILALEADRLENARDDFSGPDNVIEQASVRRALVRWTMTLRTWVISRSHPSGKTAGSTAVVTRVKRTAALKTVQALRRLPA